MAYLVTTGDDDAIHALTHGLMSREDLSYLRERVDSAVRTATGAAARYLEAARESIVQFDFGRLRDNVDNLRERFGRRWDQDRVRPLIELADLQHAKPTMRRLVMAHIRTRTLWQQGRLDGYEGLYEDDDVGVVGRRHEAYREVMHGSFVENDEGEDRFITYMGVEDENGEVELTGIGRKMVRQTWDFQDECIERGGQDFSSPLRKTF